MRRDPSTGTPRYRCTSVCQQHRGNRKPSFRVCRSWGIRCPRLIVTIVSSEFLCSLTRKDRIRTSRYQHPTIAHDPPHHLSTITPPTRHRRHIPVQMPLPFILNIERKNIPVQVLPLRCAFDQFIGVLQSMSDAVIEVSHAVGVRVPGYYVADLGTI